MIDARQINYIFAVKDIVELFAETELGSGCEVDVEKLINYVSGFSFFVNDMWGVKGDDKEAIYQIVTDDILAGFPIWQLLKIPDWTKNMLEREFAAEQERKRKELEKKFKCYTCRYFVEKQTELGVWTECTWKPPADKRDFSLKPRRGASFEPKRRCKNYERLQIL